MLEKKFGHVVVFGKTPREDVARVCFGVSFDMGVRSGNIIQNRLVSVGFLYV